MGRKSLNTEQREKIKGRWFWCVVYEQEATEIFFNRVQFWCDDFFYIRHDEDVITEADHDEWLIDRKLPLDYSEKTYLEEEVPVIGQKKKPHYHVIGYKSDVSLLGTVARQFGIPSNRVQKIDKSDDAIRYLLHLDSPGKHKYRIEEVITNNEAKLTKACNKDGVSVTDKATIILEILERDYKLSMLALCQQMIMNGVYDEFRRGQHLYTSIIWELRNKEKEVKVR